MTAILILLGLVVFLGVGWCCARGFGQCADQMGGPDDE